MKNKKNLRQQDPFLEREREQYEQPLPSREFVLQILTEQGAPVSDEELLKLLHIEAGEVDLFSRRLRAMERDGQIMRNRKRDICVVEKMNRPGVSRRVVKTWSRRSTIPPDFARYRAIPMASVF